MTVALLYAVSFVMRRHAAALAPGRWPPAFGFALAGFALLCVSGWIGGKLAYEHRVGVLDAPPYSQEARPKTARAAS